MPKHEPVTSVDGGLAALVWINAPAGGSALAYFAPALIVVLRGGRQRVRKYVANHDVGFSWNACHCIRSQ